MQAAKKDEKPVWKPGAPHATSEGEKDCEPGQKMNVQEAAYGRRMRGFTWHFCQPLTPKVSSTM